MSEWIVDMPFPKYDDRFVFDVWLEGGGVRKVRRIGNEGLSLDGALVFLDCWHPLMNVICDPSSIRGYRYREAYLRPPLLVPSRKEPQ